MAEYIEREALLKEVESRIMWSLSYNAIYEAIQIAPAADVVEVVRCKNCVSCKHCYPAKAIDEEPIEAWCCERNKKYVKPDGFCSYGERQQNDT